MRKMKEVRKGPVVMSHTSDTGTCTEVLLI